MAFEGNGGSEGMSVPPHRTTPHYHGYAVRGMFLVGALLLIIGESTGAELPLATFGTVVSAVLLVILAGITNPAIRWVHWANAMLSALYALIFGSAAVTHFRAGQGVLEFLYVEALALLFLICLYFTTRTLRAMYVRPRV